MRSLVASLLLIAGCVGDAEPVAPDAGFPDCDVAPFEADPVDVGIECAGSTMDVVAFSGFPETQVIATPPDGLELVLVNDAWRLRGRLPASDVVRVVSFDVTFEYVFDGCILRTLRRVELVIDTCDRATCEAPTQPFAIDGFCVPNRIDAEIPFSVAPFVDACLNNCLRARGGACDVVVRDNVITIGGDTCLEDIGGGCGFVCSDGDGAKCQIPGLPAGEYRLVSALGDVVVTVPRVVDEAAPPLCTVPDG